MAKKIGYGLAAALVLIAAALVLLYRTIHGEEWDKRADAVTTVTYSTYIRTVDRVETFVGDAPYRIVFGKDAEGRPAIAWVGDDGTHMEYESAGVSEAAIREKVMAQNADNDILRILPGVLDGTYVWEALYKRKEEDGTRYYYGYYRFDNGAEIDTWRMTKR
ncbi:cell wall elongation regulator TseB-like domain-containing protein [Paenibacillus sp. GYB003]|uniref:cell wall elongation regulator TseB-like domain-containing protein n=1 Tax=Paenibacillus sp. GYB003 TaxID=2994392 RepID=UPI002F961439